MVLILALLLAGFPAKAGGAFSCEEAEEVYEDTLGTIDDRPVRMRVCTLTAGEDVLVLARVNWEAPADEADVWQTLIDGTGYASAGLYTPTLTEGRLTLAAPSAGPADPVGQTTTWTWRWDSKARSFGAPAVVTTSPWAEGKAAVDAALAQGDLAAARAALATLGTSPNGGLTRYDDALYLQYLEAVEREARARHRRLDREGAAALAYDALANPPLTSPDATPHPGELVLYVGLGSSGAFNDLPLTADTANRVSALAFYLARGGQPQAALAVLDPILAHFPDSGGLILTRADARWALGQEDAARQDYQRARALLGEAALSRSQRRRAG